MWNKIAVMIIITGSSLLLTPFEVEARGGGRGGGRSTSGARGGGSYRGGHTMNRTPTMSRASSRPTTSQARKQIQTRPSVSQRKVQQSRQAIQQRATTANRAELRNQVNRYAKSRPVQNIDRQAIKQNTQDFSNKRSNLITQNRQLSDKVSKRLQQSRPGSNHWFDRNFFDRHNIDMGYVGTRANWWRPASWATLASWGAWNWSTPYYYDDRGYAYPLSTTTTYAQPVQTLPVQIDQSTMSTHEDWLPLGVFAVASNANTAAYTNRFIQLAINCNGEIAGVLYNSTTDAAQDLIGMIDPTSQKAYWLMANRTDSPIASTGIYNLTEDQTPINVYFTDGSNQIWTLVRLQQGQ